MFVAQRRARATPRRRATAGGAGLCQSARCGPGALETLRRRYAPRRQTRGAPPRGARHASILLPVTSHKLPARQDDPLRLGRRPAEREVEHEQHDDDGGRGAHGHVLPVLASRREVCARGNDARLRENSMESDAFERRRTPAHTSPVRCDAIARPQLACREVRVSGGAALMVAVP